MAILLVLSPPSPCHRCCHGIVHGIPVHIKLPSGGTKSPATFHRTVWDRFRALYTSRVPLSDAKTILADEPTGNLDTENSELVFDLLHRLAHEEGYCIIVVTHDLSIADKADEVLKLKDGMLAE